MKKKSDKDTANKPVDQQAGNASAEKNAVLEPVIETPTEEIKNMEVHHHTHPTHGKKTWKNYFWEFLMLFLAVFCGFLAEWKLEHVIEHNREKEFMGSMIVDLHTDSANLAKMNAMFSDIAMHIDLLIPLLQDNNHLDDNANRIYEHQLRLNLYNKWAYADRTIDQLKNSGNFRLIRNKAVSNGISTYDSFIRNYIDEMQNSLILKQWYGVNDAGNAIFRSNVFRAFIKNGTFNYDSVVAPGTPHFLTKDKLVMDEFINQIDQYAVSLVWFKTNIDRALQLNQSLDALIRAEYDIY